MKTDARELMDGYAEVKAKLFAKWPNWETRFCSPCVDGKDQTPEATNEGKVGRKPKDCTVYPEHIFSMLNGKHKGVQMVRCKCGARRAGTPEEIKEIRRKSREAKPIPRGRAECQKLKHEPDGFRKWGHSAHGQVMRCRHCHMCETWPEAVAA